MERVLALRAVMNSAEIPEKDRKILSFVFGHLKRVADHSDINKMIPSNLAGEIFFFGDEQMT